MALPDATLMDGEEEFGPAADAMLRDHLIARGVRDPDVLRAMRTVPRHRFVSPFLQARAYDDAALPTEDDQTISQPYIVAAMTEALAPRPTHKALEIGTGSGYQTLILALLTGRVVTIERHASLAESARQRLTEFAIGNVEVHIGDGTLGRPKDAPYDRILVTAGSPPEPPKALLDQLADGGRMVIPLGDQELQRLVTIDKRGDTFTHNTLFTCRFVPLSGKQGWTEEKRMVL